MILLMLLLLLSMIFSSVCNCCCLFQYDYNCCYSCFNLTTNAVSSGVAMAHIDVVAAQTSVVVNVNVVVANRLF